jgi:hypothetical protein
VDPDALVEALEARREQRQPLLLRELLDHVLRQLAALRGQRDHTVPGRAAVDRLERRGDDVDAQHHPAPPPYGFVVDLAVGRAACSRGS